jgi:hypothetical protein
LQRATLDVAQDARPQLHAFAERERVGMRSCFAGTRQHVQTAQHDDRTMSAIERGELVGARREGQVHRDGDDLRERIDRRRPLQQVLVPVTHLPR